MDALALLKVLDLASHDFYVRSTDFFQGSKLPVELLSARDLLRKQLDEICLLEQTET